MRSLTLCRLAFAVLAFGGGAMRGEDNRFSQKLSAVERDQIGITKLSPDQLSILDTLVQREQSMATDFSRKEDPGYRFSQRIAPDKRHSAGLDLLNPTELGRLDEVVLRNLPESPARSEMSSRSAPISTDRLVYAKPQVHGQIGMFYAVGSHGFSQYGGSIEVNYTDPKDRYMISVAYAEVHTKGGYQGRNCFISPLERDTSVTLVLPPLFSSEQ